jgi:hypothetical protein
MMGRRNLFQGIRHALDRSHNVGCTLDEELRITYCNPAWDSFASQNDGAGALSKVVLGGRLPDFMSGPLKRIYMDLFQKASGSERVWPLEFECSSPTRKRTHRMEVYPLGSEGFLNVYAHMTEQPHTDPERAADPHIYTNPDIGLLTMCSNCRKTRREGEPDVWDWVPAHLKAPYPHRTTHGICHLCWAYYYPQIYRNVFMEDALQRAV